MTPEGIVVKEVQRYFSQPKFQKFSRDTEYPVQMGSDNRRADVVLVDNKGDLIVIAECKRLGVEGNGINQLKSYLSATDTSLGIFANGIEPDSWNFYENLGKNRFREIVTRSEFEKRIVKDRQHLVTRVLDFFGGLFRPKLNESIKDDLDDKEPARMEINGELVEPITVGTPPKPRVEYIEDRSLQNEYRDNMVDVNLNGHETYYSEQNGFYWAANHQGIAECVPQHIKRIIHNEELEIDSTRDEVEQQINYLREEVVELEVQRRECEQEVEERSQEFAEKKQELAGLEVQLNALTVTESETPPPEVVSDNSEPKLFNLTDVDHIPETPVIKPFKEEINNLIQEETDLAQAINEKNQVVARKKEELAGLEVELQSPTETELNPVVVEIGSDGARPAKHTFFGISLTTAILSTVFFVLLATYLFIFYASAVDKAFFLNTEAIQAQLSQGTYAGVNDVVNPRALFKAFQGEWNLFVIMFPFVFLAFAIALDYFWERGKWMYLIALLLAVLTLIFDGILAIQISQKIHQAKVLMGQETGQWSFRLNDLNMWTVIFCGFVVSLLVSIIYHVMNQRWKMVTPIQEESKDGDLREMEIKNEKTQREARIAVLKAGMESAQDEIKQLKEKCKIVQQKILKAIRTPIETQIVVLKAEMENAQGEIEKLTNRSKAIQQKIEKVQTEIQELFRHRNKRVVNRNKMELQINQFLNGWCRFVAHSGDGISDVSAEIDRIKQVAKETLDYYYQGVPDYSPQP